MFRGEPLALNLILTGFLYFIVTLVLGLFMPDILFDGLTNVYSSHFVAAFLGWIGLVILGAQLQFFRAITATRKFEPEVLRPVYYASAVSGVALMILGNLLAVQLMIPAGLILLTVAIGIHTYWIVPKINSKLFKFPLNYLLGSHLFLLIGLGLIWVRVIDNPFQLANNFNIIHFLGIGWISLNLQGAMIRALPMFVSQVIDRPLRQHIDKHFAFSFVSSLILAFSLAYLSSGFIIFGGILWFISWIWVVFLLVKSIFMSKRELDYTITLWFMMPGLLYMAFGAMTGFHNATMVEMGGQILTRAFHIHSNLLAGLSLIMLGAMNRITSFQMFTLAYTGRRDTGVEIGDFIRQDFVKWLVPGFILLPLVMILAFADSIASSWIAVAGIVYIGHVLVFGYYLLQNYLHYKSEMENSIPYYLKKGETEADLED